MHHHSHTKGVWGSWMLRILGTCVAWAAYATLLALLSACGGGGGGGSESSSPTAPASPSSVAPLRLESGNLREVSKASLSGAELALLVGQYAANQVATVARNGSLQFDVPCSTSGNSNTERIRYTLIDADGNRVPSAGDSITLQYNRCPAPLLDDLFVDSGTLTIRLDTVADAEHGSVSGLIDFGAASDPVTGSNGSTVTWRGSMQFRRIETVLSEELAVSPSSADDLGQTIRTLNAGVSQSKVLLLQRPTLTRVIDRPTARASVTGSIRISSELLGGSVEVSFAPQLSATLNSNADSGNVSVTGASSSRVVLLPGANSDPTSARIELDANGDGTTETTLGAAWLGLHRGYLWQEASVPSAVVNAPSSNFIRLLSQPDFNQNRGVDLSRPLRLQFDRPLAPSTQLYARLRGGTSSRGDLYGDTSPSSLDRVPQIIDADVQVRGAALLIVPRQPLAWGVIYQLLLADSSDFMVAPVLRDTTGQAQALLNVQVSSFNTDDRLWPVVTGAGVRSLLLPGRSISISATAPFATALPLRWRWSQIDGPPVVIDTPDAASTTVRLPAGTAAGSARALLQLTLTDAVGRSSSSPVAIQVGNPVGLDTLLYVTYSETPLTPGAVHLYTQQMGPLSAAGPISGQPRVSITFQETRPEGERWWLDLAAPGGAAPAVGNYIGAWDMFTLLNGDAATTPMLTVGGGFNCSSQTGRFQVLDIAFDANGQLQRLAADFEQPCDLRTNDPRTVRGAVRIKSTLGFMP